jgi:ribonucleotide monophosphatase NagD (HAD superfamily)
MILIPFSDIAGANAAKWHSLLVNTGVYEPAKGPPPHLPTHNVENVEEAVSWAIEREIQRIQSTPQKPA